MRHSSLALLLTVALASTMGAQNVSTGVAATAVPGGLTDDFWDVAVTRTSNGETIVASSDARLIDPRPSPPWAFNLPGSYAWIGADFDGTLNTSGVQDGGQHNFDYVFRRMLSLATASTLNFRCATDNSLTQIRVNGNAVAGSCATWSFGGFQSLNLAAGNHTLSFELYGDGQTDGLLLDANLAASTVPEPGSMVLIATGLAIMAGVARRRRARS